MRVAIAVVVVLGAWALILLFAWAACLGANPVVYGLACGVVSAWGRDCVARLLVGAWACDN